MPILALDTSSAVAVALLADDGTVLATRSDSEQRHHAELLAPMVQHVLADAGVDRTQLTAVVAGTGPAPFTGLRVGLVTARTMALALDVPAWGVPSVDALAATAARTAEPGARVLVVTDARRREVYWAEYRVDADRAAEPIGGPDIAVPTTLVEHGRTTDALVVGRGAWLHHEALGLTDEQPDDPALLDPDPAELGRLALARHAAGQPLATTPLYLRRPDAEPSVVRKRVLT
ncbi:tRNA (adenosine(37)-N6)-threonylcarbamoyltransferase complex dimerization subunit type 1 TsaB [Cellulomonas sp. SG140]|uniref:tRNA (adenosine(37)-N6)-threonylcarbamoyltransferase complex dimerization subunit type 1 TsaB n=1 Tax=Cellulomonas sp. SG140 TaxID=2976536 RepID=UPI0021E7E387|nr:tRNA (adenosine(37)-N6)-threonylcarbamoyltransferase complex dimerization subunit type 1 TsaB [Cellulomonas sp. SG140]